MPLPDLVVLYDETYTGAIAANSYYDLPSLNAGERVFAIEQMWLWPPYVPGPPPAPADLKEAGILIDGIEYPSRLHIRAMGGRNMAIPRDDRYVINTVKFGEVSNDPIKDTSIKVLPAQRINVRLYAGAAGIAAGPTTRVMQVGRVFGSDADLVEAYGPMYQPMGPFTISDPVSKKTSGMINKAVAVSIDTAKLFAGSTQQSLPKIYPWWTWAQNLNVIPAAPEYEWSYREPRNVSEPFMDLRFDWTRLTNRALIIRHIGALIAAGRGKLWIRQNSLRRPGHNLEFYGWVINANYPNLLPPGTDPVHMRGPLDLGAIGPKVLAFNNLTEFRSAADPGTTILATNLELHVRGTYIEW